MSTDETLNTLISQSALDAAALDSLAESTGITVETLTADARRPGQVEGEPLAAAIRYLIENHGWDADDWLTLPGDGFAERFDRVIVETTGNGFKSARAFIALAAADEWLDDRTEYLNGDFYNG
jgi:hypothetical protein